MASIHAGLVPAKCSDCAVDQAQTTYWGCVSPLSKPIILDGLEEFKFYNCPVRFVLSSVTDWFEEYNYWKESSTFPRYDELTLRQREAIAIYKSSYNKYSETKRLQQKD